MNVDAPLSLYYQEIRPEWTDQNGHLSIVNFGLLFNQATDTFTEFIGITEEFRKEFRVSTFAAEIHVNYLRELLQGDRICVKTHLLGFDAKRMHYFHEMHHQTKGYIAATHEHLSLHVDMESRRVCPMPTLIQENLASVKAAHARLPVSPLVGRVIGLKSR